MPQPNLNVHRLPSQVPAEDLAEAAVVVIDLLRASTTICQALASGAEDVLPFVEVADAVAARNRLLPGRVVLGGERGGRRIDGFDLGNSPAQYTAAAVGGRRVLFTTTNGTRALGHARRARRVLVGALVNLSAVAASLAKEPRVDILCAGTDGRESREDVLAAGALVEKLLAGGPAAWKLGAAADAALAEWRLCGDDLATQLRSTPGGANLWKIGLEQDLVDCARIDTLQVVPELDTAAWRIGLR